jgi:3-oxoacyl-[acyl-carrier protein] reductase
VDLGIAGRKAIICGSSRGLGRACAEALAAEGVEVVVNGRGEQQVHATASEVAEDHRIKVIPVVADIATAEGREALVAACPDADILVTNNAGPPPGPFLGWEMDDWTSALNANMLAALALVRALLPGMRERKFGRIINIASAMVVTPHPTMSLSSGPRAGLVAVSKGIAQEVASDNVTVNNMLPRVFDTDRQIFMARHDAQRDNITYEKARQAIANTVAAKRFGRPEEFGALCAFLCSDLAGFISGNSIHLDGGSYPGLI